MQTFCKPTDGIELTSLVYIPRWKSTTLQTYLGGSFSIRSLHMIAAHLPCALFCDLFLVCYWLYRKPVSQKKLSDVRCSSQLKWHDRDLKSWSTFKWKHYCYQHAFSLGQASTVLHFLSHTSQISRALKTKWCSNLFKKWTVICESFSFF